MEITKYNIFSRAFHLHQPLGLVSSVSGFLALQLGLEQRRAAAVPLVARLLQLLRQAVDLLLQVRLRVQGWQVFNTAACWASQQRASLRQSSQRSEEYHQCLYRRIPVSQDLQRGGLCPGRCFSLRWAGVPGPWCAAPTAVA